MEEKNYYLIMALFDEENNVPLTNFCEELVKERDEAGEEEALERFLESEASDSLPEGVHDAISGQSTSYLGIGFAVGLALGQMFEIGHEEVSLLLEDLKQRILEKKVLPYHPRKTRGVKIIGGSSPPKSGLLASKRKDGKNGKRAMKVGRCQLGTHRAPTKGKMAGSNAREKE